MYWTSRALGLSVSSGFFTDCRRRDSRSARFIVDPLVNAELQVHGLVRFTVRLHHNLRVAVGSDELESVGGCNQVISNSSPRGDNFWGLTCRTVKDSLLEDGSLLRVPIAGIEEIGITH